MKRDSLGRRRADRQERGLRPLYPPLPPNWVSRLLRVCMPEPRWREFDRLVADVRGHAATEPRAIGRLVMHLMNEAPAMAPDRHWLDWEHEKARRLLDRSGRAA